MVSVSDMGAPAPCPAPFNLAAHVRQGGAAQPDHIALRILRPTVATPPGISEAAATELRAAPDTTMIGGFCTSPEPLAEAALAAHAATTLARYTQPRLYIRVEAQPRNASHKILRRKLRHDWETAHGRT